MMALAPTGPIVETLLMFWEDLDCECFSFTEYFFCDGPIHDFVSSDVSKRLDGQVDAPGQLFVKVRSNDETSFFPPQMPSSSPSLS